jgi:hypothetical protein
MCRLMKARNEDSKMYSISGMKCEEPYLPKVLYFAIAMAAIGIAIGFACKSGAPPAPTCPLLVKTFTETSQIPGYYCLCWDQISQTGDSIPIIATYELRVTAGTYKTHLEFDVVQKAAHVPATGCCAVGAEAAKPDAPIPDSYYIRVNASVYAPGDDIAITYALPVTSDVQIEIHALLACP